MAVVFLSRGGKEVFIKSILQAILTYGMTYVLFPKSLCVDLQRIFIGSSGKRLKGNEVYIGASGRNCAILKKMVV